MENRIVRVNMRTKQIAEEALPAKGAAYGGRALTSAIVSEEVPPTATPLGPTNKLVFAPGLLGGSSAPISGRLSEGAKSPLTGTIKESNAGGQAGQILARLGIRALIIEDRPEDPAKRYTLEIRQGGLKLVECPELAGLGSYGTVEKLVVKYGDKRKWNQAAGFTNAHDRLPDWMRTEPLSPHGALFTVPDAELDQVYNFVT